MSDLHQYELHYLGFDKTSGGTIDQTRLVWAYSAQEAVFQFELEWKVRHHLDCRITEAGPVKKAPAFPPDAHFHVCPECQDVVLCKLEGCPAPEQSDLQEPCRKCVGRKPHRHYCCICLNEYDCTWKEVHSTCGPHDSRDIPCRNHSAAEIMTFFRNQGLPPEKV